jgi:CheY-like chemotaxis protein
MRSNLALLVQPSETDARTLIGLLGVLGWEAVECCTAKDALDMMQIGSHRPAVVLCSTRLPDQTADSLIQKLRYRYPDVTLVATEAEDGPTESLTGMLARPFGLDSLQKALGR